MTNTEGFTYLRDLAYAHVDGRDLLLDLYLPDETAGPKPVIVWIHGGAWRTGSKDTPRAARMAQRGYAVASIQYRLSQDAIYPAQIHDCKAAVRWLRANARQHGLDPDRVGAWGASAGGHLAAMLGTTGSVAELEGTEGDLAYSSRVQAVCDFFGPTDFTRMNDLPGAMDHDAADSPESQLIGGPVQEHPEEVARANPITYIGPDAPPFLIVHGDQDYTVLLNQSELLHAALGREGLDTTLHVVEGAGHGFQGALAGQIAEIDHWVDAFFDAHLIG